MKRKTRRVYVLTYRGRLVSGHRTKVLARKAAQRRAPARFRVRSVYVWA